MTEKKVVVLQSNYLPWKGYFDLIMAADHFIFYDDVQFTKNDWRNRNQIKTKHGMKWLSIPCGTNLKRLICEVNLTDSKWQQNHWSTLVKAYQDSKHFNEYKDFFEAFYLDHTWTSLSELNQFLIKNISSKILGNTKTKFDDSRNYSLQGQRQDRLLDLLKKVDATHYISGPSGKNYMDLADFSKLNIEVSWFNYNGYPEYEQLYGKFEHFVSIIDLIFNKGSEAKNYLLNRTYSENLNSPNF